MPEGASQPRLRRTAPVSLATMTALLGLVLLTLLPPSGALRIHPTYYTQCYGTQEGWVVGAQYGYSNTSGWSNNYSNGHLGLISQSSQASQAASNSGYSTGGWISMGPGPTNGLCFTPSNTSGHVVYTFVNVSFSVALYANCTSAFAAAARASYNVSFQGNVYDLSTATFVWSASPSTVVHQRAIACSSAATLSMHRTFALTHSVQVAGATTGFRTGDRYWFIVDVDVTTTVSAAGTGSTASASVSQLSTTLAGIRCAVC